MLDRATKWTAAATVVLLVAGIGTVVLVADGDGDDPDGPGRHPTSTTTAGAGRGGVASSGNGTGDGASMPTPSTSGAGAGPAGEGVGHRGQAAVIVDEGRSLVLIDVGSGETITEIARAAAGNAFSVVASSPSVATLAVVEATPGAGCDNPGTVSVAVEGGELERLGSGGGVAVSPDGTRVAYTVGACEGDPDAVVVRDLRLGSERRLALSPRSGAPDGLVSSLVAWMPAGDRLVYVWGPDPAESLQLLTIHLESGEVSDTGVRRDEETDRSWTAVGARSADTVLLAESSVDLERAEVRGDLTVRRLADGATVGQLAQVGSVITDIAAARRETACILYVAGGTLFEQCGAARREVRTGVAGAAWAQP